MSSTTGHRSSAAGADTAAGGSSSQSPDSKLNLAQVLGGALAAVTSALAASSLGVAGTLTGAFLGSLVATVGAAVYAESLVRAGKRLRVVRPVSPADDGRVSAARTDVTLLAGRQRDADALVFVSRRSPAARRWLRLTAGLVSGLAIALAALTGFELVIGRPVSGAASGTTSGTTIGGAVSGRAGAGSSDTSVVSPTSRTTGRSTVTRTATATTTVTPTAETSPSAQPTPSATSREYGATSDTDTGSATPTAPARQSTATAQPTG